MKTTLKSIGLAALASFAIYSCTADRKDNIQSLKWMLGKWESKTAEGVLYEEWQKGDDSTYLGHAFAISFEGDTTFSEKALITQRQGTITYSVTVNNEETTDFIMVSNEKVVVFENEEHDYPQRIIYEKSNADSLYAKIEGKVDGELTSEEFKYAKIKKEIL